MAIGQIAGITLTVVYTPGMTRAASSRRDVLVGENDVSTSRRLASDRLRAEAHVDLGRLRATSDEEIAEQIAADPDTAPDMGAATGWRVVRRAPAPDVRRVRTKLGLSQAAFAERFGLRARTVQEWEQGRAVPDQPARVLLKVIEEAPDTVARIVRDS